MRVCEIRGYLRLRKFFNIDFSTRKASPDLIKGVTESLCILIKIGLNTFCGSASWAVEIEMMVLGEEAGGTSLGD